MEIIVFELKEYNIRLREQIKLQYTPRKAKAQLRVKAKSNCKTNYTEKELQLDHLYKKS